MIGRLEGCVHQVSPGTVIIDVGGVGYLVSTTLRAFQELSGRERAELWIHTQVRDDAIVLFGFSERDELEAFEQLIAVAGVGPRTALAVLSGLDPGALSEAVDGGNSARLQSVPGVGKKTAERIILELKGKLAPGAGAVADHQGDAVSALVNLGYPQRAAVKAVNAVVADNDDLGLGDVLRLALQRLTK